MVNDLVSLNLLLRSEFKHKMSARETDQDVSNEWKNVEIKQLQKLECLGNVLADDRKYSTKIRSRSQCIEFLKCLEFLRILKILIFLELLKILKLEFLNTQNFYN